MRRSVPASLLRAPFRGTEAVRAGLLSNRQLQAATWQRILPDIYLHTAVELTHRVRSTSCRDRHRSR